MANIRNSISMTDRMTPTLRSILKSMDSMLKVMKDLDRASNNGAQSKAYRRAEKDIQRANNALIKMDNYNRMVSRSARDGERAYDRMGSAISRANSNMSSMSHSSSMFLQSLASGVYLAQKLANAVGGVMNTADTARSQVARLGLYNTSAYTNEDLYGQVFRTAMDTRSGLTDTADLTNKLLISGIFQGEGATGAAINTAGLINKALVAGGGSHEENQRALRQLTQGLASGVLQGDELRSIREQTPYFAEVLAKGLSQIDKQFEGIGVGDLKELGASGELTAERVVKAMWAMQDEIDKDFAEMPRTFGQALTGMSNIWQYFLWMLSDADGPLGKINDRLWQFVDYLQSPQGLELLNTVAVGINFVATALSGALGAAGRFVTFLQENAPIAQALFISLGIAAAWAGISTAVAWIAAVWPILLVIGAVALVAYWFLRAGYTAQEVIGGIAGGVLWLLSVIWNVVVGIVAVVIGALATIVIAAWDIILAIISLVMTLVSIIITVVVKIVTIIIHAVQAIIQVITWAVMAIITVFWLIKTVVDTVVLLIQAGFQTAAIGVAGSMYALAQTVLGVLGLIASGIDAVFGSNLADAVSGWSGTLETKFTQYAEEHDPKKTIEEIGTIWNEFGSGVQDMFTGDKYNLYDEWDNLDKGANNLVDGMWNLNDQGQEFLGDLVVNPLDGWSKTIGFAENYVTDPGKWFDTGYNWGSGLVDDIAGLQLGIPSNSVLDRFNQDSLADSIAVNGGDLDSVGSIKSDVSLKDEDLKLLRDMAARDYLLQLQSITPVAHVTFGDVRETADVGKIIEAIEQMVEEQMATSLVS